jgi:hypothetical protein
MKRLLAICLLFFTFCGCNTANSEMDDALALRQQLLKSQGCRFVADISADYQDSLYSFSLECEADKNGFLKFTVLQPESISGITGTVSTQGGKLTFDDKVLAFPLLADGLLSPVSAPWIFLQAMRGGYIKSCGKDADGLLITINDTFSGEPLYVDIFSNENGDVNHSDIFWHGRRILSMDIKDIVYL